MKLFGRELVGFAKVLVVLVAVLLVSAGLCGLQLAIGNRLASNSDTFLMLLGIAELIAMLVSAVGIVLVLLVWGARGLYRLSQAESGLELQKRSSNESPTKHDEEQ
jgi:hypothetical protein